MRSRKSAKDRKAEIVRAAISLAGEIGPDRVTTQHIADAVGLTQPAIFRHFPTKADIWLAVGEQIVQAMDEGVIDDGGPDPAARLTALVASHLGSIARSPALPSILFSRELHVENEALRAHFERVLNNRRAGFARLIGRAQQSGRLSCAMPPEDMAALILALIQGLAMRWSMENHSFDLEAEGTRLLAGLLRPA